MKATPTHTPWGTMFRILLILPPESGRALRPVLAAMGAGPKGVAPTAPSSGPPPRPAPQSPPTQSAPQSPPLSVPRSPGRGPVHVEVAPSLPRGLVLAAKGSWTLVILSLAQDGASPELAARVAQLPGVGALLLSHPEPTLQRTIEAEGAGAATLLPEPLDPEQVWRELERATRQEGGIPLPLHEAASAPTLVGSSPAVASLFRTLARVAPTPATVLIQGESGTGKELVARALHQGSPRGNKAFVALNCAAIPEHLLEAELFGHEKGAFTGAVGRSEGRFGRADGGTLFLDEIGDMSLVLQAKILRALEEGEIERVGGRGTVPVDVRIVAATNRPLRELVAAGAFRADLYFRLAVVELLLPPLRERPGDIQELALHFAARFAAQYDRPVRRLALPALERLLRHDWPGNVRELRNVLDRAVLLARGSTLEVEDLEVGGLEMDRSEMGGMAPPFGGSPSAVASPSTPGTRPDSGAGVRDGREPDPSAAVGGLEAPAPGVDSTLGAVEAWHIGRVLTLTGGHMGEASRILGIHRNTLTSKVRDHGLQDFR